MAKKQHQLELTAESSQAPASPDAGNGANTQETNPPANGGQLSEVARATRVLHLSQEFFIPVHEFVKFSDAEVAVIDHPALQRLGEIYQLGQAHLVFRGATHKRLEHCLGTVAAAAYIIAAVQENHDAALAKNATSEAHPLSPCERAFVRLAALTHDIGHLPAGHTLEDELGLLDKHDFCARLNYVLDRTKWAGVKVESLRSVIDREYKALLSHDAPFTPSELVIQLIAKDPPQTSPFDRDSDSLKRPVRIALCRDIVGNTICADLLDYLHRDWYHIGKPKHFDRRLLQYMEIRTDSNGDDAFVVSLGRRPKVRPDAVSAILDLLESRYQLAETVLFHRTKLAFAAMLERGLQEVASRKPPEWREQLAENLLDLPDVAMVDFFIREASGNKAALYCLERLRHRRVFVGLFTRFSEEYPADVVTRLIDTYTGAKGGDTATQKRRAQGAAEARLQTLRVLEQDFALPAGSLAMYCPDSMNAKIAKVKIAVDGQIAPFDRWEDHPNRLSGGHLAAQQNRFKRLWRVHIFIDDDVSKQMSHEKRLLLKAAIKELVYPKNVDQATMDEAAFDLATRATHIPDMPLYGAQVGAPAVGARRDRDAVAAIYPTGAFSLRAFRR